MASEKDASCENDPNFAIICAFFQKFSTMLNIQHPDIQLLKEWFENTDEVSPELKDLHIKLLRKMRKTVHETAWETALSKFCYMYSSQDAWEIERFGYKKSSLKVKLRILKELLEHQFERNGKFRNNFSALSADELRGEPIGRDKLGHSYWLTQDRHCNIRIYQEHLDEEIWQVVATNRDELVTLIARLKGNEVVLPSLLSVIDEDSSSNSYPGVIVKPPPPEEQDESQDEKTNSSEGKIPNIKIKLDTSKMQVVSTTANGNLNKDNYSDSESDYRGEEDGDPDENDDIEENGDLKETQKVSDKKKVCGEENHHINGIIDTHNVDTNEQKEQQKNGYVKNEQEIEKKVKPIVISQAKLSTDKISKKRTLEESEKSVQEENLTKKFRPTLLGNNREKKISKYEKFKDVSEDEDDDVDGEEEEGEEEEQEGEEEDDEEEEEEEDDDTEAEEEEELGEQEEVSEEIEEELMVIRCDGNGKDCESSYSNFLQKINTGDIEESPVGEAIEEDVFFVIGEGSGEDCLVGNSKEDDNEKESICFDKKDNEKLKIIKKDGEEKEKSEILKSKENKSDSSILIQNEKTSDNNIDEITNGEEVSKDNINLNKIKDSDNINNLKIKNTTNNVDNKNSISKVENSSAVIKIIEMKSSSSPTSPSKSEVPKSEIAEKTTTTTDCEEKDIIEKNNGEKLDLEKDCNKISENQKSLDATISQLNRKRRLSDDRPRQNSESETDLNSEVVEEITKEDIDIGGKRPKMRCKIINTNIRKKIEAERKDAVKESSSEEESPRKDLCRKSPPKSIEKECEKEIKPNIKKEEENKSYDLNVKDDPLALDKKDQSDIKIEPLDTGEEKKEKISECEILPEDLTTIKESSEVETEEIVPQIQTRSGRKKPAAAPPPNKRRGKGKRIKKDEKIDATPKDIKQKIKKETHDEVENIEENLEKLEDLVKKEDITTAENKDRPQDLSTSNEISANTKNSTPTATTNSTPTINPVNSPIPTTNSTTTPVNTSPNTPANSSPVPHDDKESHTDDIMKSKETVKRKGRKKREIDISNIIEPDSSVTPVRQSRRIAQLKIREEAERRKLEEVALKKMKEELKKKKKEEKKQTKEESEKSESSDKNESVDSEVEMKKKLEKKRRGVKQKGGWSSGTEDEPEEEEEEFQYEVSDVGSPLFKSDHEFSPESEIEDESQIVPMKRARTARREGEEGVHVIEGSDEACQKCGKTDHPEWILLCDKCDKGYHCSCLSPVLFIIPEGDWFCPPCQQEQLIAALELHLQEFDDLIIKKKEEEELRLRNLELAKSQELEQQAMKATTKVIKLGGKQPRIRPGRRSRRPSNYDDDSDSRDSFSKESKSNRSSGSGSSKSSRSSSGSSSSSSSSGTSTTDSEDEPIYKLRKRRQVNVSYQFHEYDDLINSAIKEEMDEVAGAGNLGRGKDISTIIEADKEEKRLKQIEAQKVLQISTTTTVAAAAAAVSVGNVNTDLVEQGSENIDVKKEDIITKDINKLNDDSGSDFEPLKAKPKLSSRRNIKKKNRKLNCLDVSSDDDGSDEDFKTSSYETDEEDESVSGGGTESDSSLEIYKYKSKKNKKNSRRSSRRAARQRRKRYDNFVVDDSDLSEEFPKIKKKRKEDSDYTESETEEGLSEDVDSEELCDDSTDGSSDGAWRPSKRKKQRTSTKVKQPKKRSNKQKKYKRSSNEKSYKAGISKNRIVDYDDENSMDSGRRTRGKRFTYLEDYDEESSDDGIKPGVKRPDTPPEEREKFIKRQEEIKRMLAEKNTEAAKVAATPTLTPILRTNKPEVTDSLSTVPLSVIKGAKALDIDYLQRRGELDTDEQESDFDDDLPDDFNPEDMDEEEIAKMMEEEDFAQQQLKLAGEVIRQKKLKETDTIIVKPEAEVIRIHRAPPAPIYETTRKRFPIPTPHPPLRNLPFHQIGNPQSFSRGGSGIQPSRPLLLQQQPSPARPLLPPPLQSSSSSIQHLPSSILQTSTPVSAGLTVQAISPVPESQIPTVVSQASPQSEVIKPRGRRKKITPLRDTLQKQQAAAAAAAAASSTSTAPGPGQTVSPSSAGNKTDTSVGVGVSVVSGGVGVTARGIGGVVGGIGVVTGGVGVTTGAIGVLGVPRGGVGVPGSGIGVLVGGIGGSGGGRDKPAGGNLSVAQPPQLYKPPNNTQPSVITRMAQPNRPRFPEQGSRFFGPPNQMGQRPTLSVRPPPMSVPTSHLSMRPSYASGPPPLRPANNGPPAAPVSLGNGIPRHTIPPRQPPPPFTASEQFTLRPRSASTLNPYRPPLYGTPGYPPAPPGHTTGQGPSTQPSSSLHSTETVYSAPSFATAPFGSYYPTSIGTTHSTPPPPTATAVPSSVIVSATANAATTPPTVVVSPPSVTESQQPIQQPSPSPSVPSRPKATLLETFDSKSTPPPESETTRSPYTNVVAIDENDDEEAVARNSTSEFSGLVSYFSSQQDDLNT